MNTAAFIAGDWGTSHLRLNLCDHRGAVLASQSGPGVARVNGDFAATFSNLTSEWTQHGPLPTLLCGMVGSNIGWASAPYVACPTDLHRLADHMLPIEDRNVWIAPGLSWRNDHGTLDVMRGEETQILGALCMESSLRSGTHLLCLPGTHAKWVVIEEGRVCEFFTSVTGELFDIIKQHSVLVRREASSTASPETVFRNALEHSRRNADASLLHRLFACRTLQISGELAAGDAAHYLSGLLIGADVAGALRQLKRFTNATSGIMLVGAPALTDLYAMALADRSIDSQRLSGADASVAGLTSLYHQRFDRGRVHVA